MLTVKVVAAFDFGSKFLPDSLISVMNEIGKNSSQVMMDLSINESITHDINKSTPSIKAGVQNRKIRPRSSKLATVRAFAGRVERPISGGH
jgi:hypothetical protein